METEQTASTATEITPVIPRKTAIPRWVTRAITLLAYSIPLTFLVYVLYINHLPFGYNETFTLNVGTRDDTDSRNNLYLEPSTNLSEPQFSLNFSLFRELNGIAYLVFTPPVALENAEITVKVEGDGIKIIPPVIDFNPDSIEWDYAWDFTQNKTPEELGLTGSAFPFDRTMHFDGTNHLELPDSSAKFEDEPFSVYVEWIPQDSENNGQQIVGHFDWELWQNSNSVEFRIGRMTDENGPAYYIKHEIGPDFFTRKHSALAVYNPSDSGYINLYVDGHHAGRKYFGTEKIWKEYGNQNMSLGWTLHNSRKNPHFTGGIATLKIKTGEDVLADSLLPTATLHYSGTEPLPFALVSMSNSHLDSARLHVKQP